MMKAGVATEGSQERVEGVQQKTGLGVEHSEPHAGSVSTLLQVAGKFPPTLGFGSPNKEGSGQRISTVPQPNRYETDSSSLPPNSCTDFSKVFDPRVFSLPSSEMRGIILVWDHVGKL